MIKTNSNQKAIESITSLDDGSIVIKFQQPNSEKIPLKTNDDDDYEQDKISQIAAAKFCGVSVQTLINWRKKNLIQEYRIGRPVFYRKSELRKASKGIKEMLKQ